MNTSRIQPRWLQELARADMRLRARSAAHAHLARATVDECLRVLFHWRAVFRQWHVLFIIHVLLVRFSNLATHFRSFSALQVYSSLVLLAHTLYSGDRFNDAANITTFCMLPASCCVFVLRWKMVHRNHGYRVLLFVDLFGNCTLN